VKNSIIFRLSILGTLLALAACQPQQATPPPDFSVISSPAVPVLPTAPPTPAPPTDTPPPPAADASADGGDATLFEMVPATVIVSTDTPSPATPTLAATTIETQTVASAPLTATVVTTATATPKPAAPAPTAEPMRGGSFDMEDGFEGWTNPHGDPCVAGAKLATGWQAFTSQGEFGSSCFYLNDYGPNVFSGQYSQQVTFDFVDSQAGIFRVLDTRPGHQYEVTARLRHVHTQPPMQFHFGLDLSGGEDWQADSVDWTPWAEFREDEWMTHVETFTATSARTTIFIKGFHNTASQGGATYIDAIEVVDLG